MALELNQPQTFNSRIVQGEVSYNAIRKQMVIEVVKQDYVVKNGIEEILRVTKLGVEVFQNTPQKPNDFDLFFAQYKANADAFFESILVKYNK